jgi:hypothetical protein
MKNVGQQGGAVGREDADGQRGLLDHRSEARHRYRYARLRNARLRNARICYTRLLPLAPAGAPPRCILAVLAVLAVLAAMARRVIGTGFEDSRQDLR